MQAPLYSLLCCSLTLISTLLVLMITPSHLMIISGDNTSRLQDLPDSSLPAAGEARQANQHQGNPKQGASLTSIVRRLSVRKLVPCRLRLLMVDVAPQLLHRQNDIADKQQLSHPYFKYATVRKLLQHEQVSISAVTINPSGAAAGTQTMSQPTNTRNPHHEEHDVNESTSFHVDYNRPKTHPPKNN